MQFTVVLLLIVVWIKSNNLHIVAEGVTIHSLNVNTSLRLKVKYVKNYISVLDDALWDVGRVRCGICEIGLLYKREITHNYS